MVLHYWFSLFVCICLLHAHTNIIRHAFVLTWKLYCKVTNIVSSRCLKPACEDVILWDGITLRVRTWTQMAVILQSCCFPTVALYHLYYRWITGKLTKKKKKCYYTHIQKPTTTLSSCNDWTATWAKPHLWECSVTQWFLVWLTSLQMFTLTPVVFR